MHLELLAKQTFTVEAHFINDDEEFTAPASCWIPNQDDITSVTFSYGSRRRITRIDAEDDECYFGVEFSINGFVFMIEVISKDLALIDDLFAIQDQLYQKT